MPVTATQSKLIVTVPGSGITINGDRPDIQPLTEADTSADAFLESSYALTKYSTVSGTISSAVREINYGAGWTTTLDDPLELEQTIKARVRVTNSEASEAFFGLGQTLVTEGVEVVSPSWSGNPSVSGTMEEAETLTFTWPTLTVGSPEATATYHIDRSDDDGETFENVLTSENEIASYALANTEVGYRIRARTRAQGFGDAVEAISSYGSIVTSIPVGGSAPVITLVVNREGNAVTYNLTEMAGSPMPTVEFPTLTLDAVNVLSSLSPAGTGPGADTVATSAPGEISGGGTIVTALSGALDIGAWYLVEYTVSANSGDRDIYFGSGAGSPFSYRTLETSVGTHYTIAQAQDADTAALMRVGGGTTGTITFTDVKCRKVSWSYTAAADSEDQNLAHTFEATNATSTATNSATTIIPGEGAGSGGSVSEFYVSTSGNDSTGDGSIGSPWRTPKFAATTVAGRIQAATESNECNINLRGGSYSPFFLQSLSGKTDQWIRIRSYPGETATISGVGLGTTGGTFVGNTGAVDWRGLIQLNACNYFELSGLRVIESNFDLIHYSNIGNSVPVTGNVRISNNTLHGATNSAVYIAGKRMSPANDPAIGEVRIANFWVEGNDIFDVNRSKGNEAISVGGGTQYIYVRNNTIDTCQYGVDFKLGVMDGEISGNFITGARTHAIYLDAASYGVVRVNIFGNTCTGNNNGITLTRENARQPSNATPFEDFNIYNNVCTGNSRYGFLHYGIASKDNGNGTWRNIQVFGNDFRNNANNDYRFATPFALMNNIDFHGNLSNDSFVDGGYTQPGQLWITSDVNNANTAGLPGWP